MLNWRPILHILGVMLCILALAMLIPAYVDMIYDDRDWMVFLVTSLFTLFLGITLALNTRLENRRLTLREAFLTVAVLWLSLSFFGAIPLWLSDLGLSFVDALFESVSGLTTTGASVIRDLNLTPPGILIWRSLLQWLGGIGIVIMTITVLPMLGVGGMHFFATEYALRADKVLPRILSLARGISSIYIGLTAACVILLSYAGMSTFDAINHAMTTISTGGFSTHDESLGYYQSPIINMVVIIFMILGSLPFILYLKALYSGLHVLLEDAQVKFFLAIVMIASAGIAGILTILGTHPTFLENLHHSFFNTISLMTGTGFTSTDTNTWAPLLIHALIFLMFFGGCVGSTTGGIKIFRIQILLASIHTQLKRLVQPQGVFMPTYNNKPVTEEERLSVTGFLFVYIMAFVILALLLSATGIDFMTAFSGAAAALSNVGPGFGPLIGAGGTYAPLGDAAKLMLCAGMLLGRLELFTLMVLFSRRFWRDY